MKSPSSKTSHQPYFPEIFFKLTDFPHVCLCIYMCVYIYNYSILSIQP